jgi:hypothetical protein
MSSRKQISFHVHRRLFGYGKRKLLKVQMNASKKKDAHKIFAILATREAMVTSSNTGGSTKAVVLNDDPHKRITIW